MEEEKVYDEKKIEVEEEVGKQFQVVKDEEEEEEEEKVKEEVEK